MDDPTKQAGAVPVYDESMGGALIDAARISLMAAMRTLPPPEAFTRIVLPGEEPAPSVHDCLEHAMGLLNLARAMTIEQSKAAPTSLHVVGGGQEVA